RVRLDFGDPFIALDNQAAIIYTARSRRFYLQSIASETWLNEQPTQDSVELAGGEVLQLGQTRLRFVPLCGTDFDWRDNA
ncbi:MAG: FHA domain-containing protein, partial [Candidatus Competibacter sp.]